jgi:hypothetical protein
MNLAKRFSATRMLEQVARRRANRAVLPSAKENASGVSLTE